MRTTETVKTLGLYASACCKEELLFDRNETFLRCPACETLCLWHLVEPVISWVDLEEITLIAA